MKYAGFWRRFVAILIDTVILIVCFVPIISIIIVPIVFSLDSSAKTPEEIEQIKLNISDFTRILSSTGQWLYFSLMESSSKQATLGKMAMGIYVTDLNGNRISFGRATGRYLGKVISALILLIGFLMAGFTEKKQALHDKIAGCLVVRKGTRNSAQQVGNVRVNYGGISNFSITLSSGQTIYFTVGMKLTDVDIPGLKSNSFDGAVVEVNCNPNDPTALGLKNLSRQTWTVVTPSGQNRQIEFGQSIKLAVGTRINFGSVTGEIR